jgi:hypothetical protein
VKPLKKEYAARRGAAAARAREAEHKAARAGANASASSSPDTPLAPAPLAGGAADWRPVSAMLRLKAASFTATYAPKARESKRESKRKPSV